MEVVLGIAGLSGFFAVDPMYQMYGTKKRKVVSFTSRL